MQPNITQEQTVLQDVQGHTSEVSSRLPQRPSDDQMDYLAKNQHHSVLTYY